jgi:hypothetical protein
MPFCAARRKPFIWSNKKLLLAFGFSFFCIFNIMYNPVVQSCLGAGPLSITDWLLAFSAAGAYLIIRLVWRGIFNLGKIRGSAALVRVKAI